MLVVADRLAERGRADEARATGEALAAAVEAKMADPARIDSEGALTRSIEPHARTSGVRAVLVWDADGAVVWSTHEILRGQEFQLDREVIELFEDGPGFVANEGEHPT